MEYPTFAYPLQLEAAPGTHIAHFTDFPEALTEGPDVATALARAADALEEAVAARMLDREDIPAPSPATSGNYVLAVPAATAAKAAIYLAMREAKISNVELARRLGIDERQVRRLLDPAHGSKLADIDRALRALGSCVEIAAAPLARKVRQPRVAAKTPARSAAKPRKTVKPKRKGERRGMRIAAKRKAPARRTVKRA